MLNIIWSGLIIISILFSIGHDISDELSGRYANHQLYTAHYSYQIDTDQRDSGFINLILNGSDVTLSARLISRETMSVVSIPVDQALPSLWKEVAKQQSAKDKTLLLATVTDLKQDELSFYLPEVHWVKARAITDAAFEMAKFAVKLAIGLAGLMALWLGLMKIAEASGLMMTFVRMLRPILRYLFPAVPENHPALGSISMNMAANILGLGNAATPMGIRAMQQLQELNKKKDEASDSMCMFLAINTSSVQLLPPVTLIALMGASVSEVIIPIILATTVSTLVAVAVVRFYVRRGRA